MALVGLKVVNSNGSPLGVTAASARVFGLNHLIVALTTPLRAMGPIAQGGTMFALGVSNAAVAVVNPEHRTLWNRLARTAVVRA